MLCGLVQCGSMLCGLVQCWSVLCGLMLCGLVLHGGLGSKHGVSLGVAGGDVLAVASDVAKR